MPERRRIEQVRAEIAEEQARLAEDLAALREDAKAAVPYAIGGIAALAVLKKGRGLARALGLIRLLR